MIFILPSVISIAMPVDDTFDDIDALIRPTRR